MTLILSAVALISGAAITYSFVHSFLLDRLDSQLVSERGRLLSQLDTATNPNGVVVGSSTIFMSSGAFAQFVSADGQLQQTIPSGVSAPRLPDPLPSGKTWVTASSSNGTTYRVYVAPVTGPLAPTGEIMIYGRPLAEVTDTLNRFVLIEALVTAIVLLLVGMMGFFAIQIGLRPLEEVIATADAIASGDMSLRVPEETTRTEVGRLSHAFNAMLGNIERAFTRQREVEQQLRTFVADASHELRTPLTPMRGYLELLARPDLADEDRIFAMERVKASTDRMQRLVDDLLLLARLDAQPAMNVEEVDLSELVAGAISDHRAADPDRPLETDVEKGILVYGDPDYLARVVANLLANIRIHTPAGTATRIALRADDGVARLEIADDGPGIPAEARRHLFDRFYRVDASRGSGQGGSGLGLSIVAAIVRMHDGEISLESDAGAGTTIHIAIPLAPGDRG